MSTLLRDFVAKHVTNRTEEPTGQPDKTTTKVNRELLKKAKSIANHRGLDLYDYLDHVLRPLVEKDYRDYIRTESKESQ